MIAFILLFAISKRIELPQPDCTHFEVFFSVDYFLKKIIAFLEVEICFVGGVAKLISQIVIDVLERVPLDAT